MADYKGKAGKYTMPTHSNSLSGLEGKARAQRVFKVRKRALRSVVFPKYTSDDTKAMARLTKSVLVKTKKRSLAFQIGAVKASQAAGESFAVEFFQDMQRFARHDNRETLQLKDLQALVRMMKRWTVWLNGGTRQMV